MYFEHLLPSRESKNSHISYRNALKFLYWIHFGKPQRLFIGLMKIQCRYEYNTTSPSPLPPILNPVYYLPSLLLLVISNPFTVRWLSDGFSHRTQNHVPAVVVFLIWRALQWIPEVSHDANCGVDDDAAYVPGATCPHDIASIAICRKYR